MTTSCPDWTALTAHRRGDAGPSAAGSSPSSETWAAAMAHLDLCTGCRDEALAADPTLLFRRLPTVEADADEIAGMRAGVAALRRAERLTAPARAEDPSSQKSRAGSFTGWGRAAAAAILAAGLLTVQPGVEEPPAGPAADAWSLAANPPIAWLDEDALSAVDDIENPTASVYHFDDEEVAVVMVVDANLDV